MSDAPHTMPDRGADTSLVQGDLAVNLFMVLLSVLATLSIAAAVVSSQGYPVKMQEEGAPERPRGLSRGWNPVQQLRPRLVVLEGHVALLTTAPLAEALVNGQPLMPDVPGYDASKPLTSDPDPSAFKVLLNFGPDPLPPELIRWQLPATAFGTAEAGPVLPSEVETLIEEAPAVDILVYPDNEELAWSLAAALHDRDVPFALLFQARPRLGFQRATPLYGFEMIYK